MLADLGILWRLLTFRSTVDELRSLGARQLVLGLLLTWAVGIGRWWEDPKADAFAHLGLGSVAYVFILAAFLWLLLWPLNAPHWRFVNVLAFVSLTSPPAILYALPVRHGLELDTAQTVRLWMLAIVAGWRVALLFFYLKRGAGFAKGRCFLAGLFPLLLIIFIITSLNLEQVVFDFMGGIHRDAETVNDHAYEALLLFSLLSMLAFIPTFCAYLAIGGSSVIQRFGRGWIPLLWVIVLLLVAGGIWLMTLIGIPGAALLCGAFALFVGMSSGAANK